jgi:hypothetical protein
MPAPASQALIVEHLLPSFQLAMVAEGEETMYSTCTSKTNTGIWSTSESRSQVLFVVQYCK